MAKRGNPEAPSDLGEDIVSAPELPDFERKEEEIYKRIYEHYPRLLPDGTFVYWMGKDKKGYYLICPHGGSTRHRYVPMGDPNGVLERFDWMRRLCDAGITIDGRESEPAVSIEEIKTLGHGVNTKVAEIIQIYRRDHHKNLPNLYLIRWTGENMGTAALVPFEDLRGCSEMIRAFNAEERKMTELKDFALWQHIKAGAKCKPRAGRASKFDSANTITPNKRSWKKHGRGRKKTLFKGLKNPAWSKKKFRKALRIENSCLFDILDSEYHVLPRHCIEPLASLTLKDHDSFASGLNSLLAKHNAGMVVTSLHDKTEDVKLRDAIPKDEGTVFVQYRGVGISHCGVMVANHPTLLKRFKVLNSNEHSLEEQDIFKEDLENRVFFVRTFKLTTVNKQ